jgi:septin family protein
MNIINIVKNNKKVLICGKDSSGKTGFMKSIVIKLSKDEHILVLSNHKEIKREALNHNNVELLHKPKDCTYVDMKFLKTDANYIFIDEICENIEEICDNLQDKHLIFVKTVNDKLEEKDKEFFDSIISVKKNKLGVPALDKILK